MTKDNEQAVYAAEDFEYKNNYAGDGVLDKTLPHGHVFRYKKGDLLPAVVAERKLRFNPFQVTSEKVKEKPEEKKEDPKPEEKPAKPLVSIGRKAAIAMTKKEQEDELLKRGLSKKEVRDLQYEDDRVEKLLETNP